MAPARALDRTRRRGAALLALLFAGACGSPPPPAPTPRPNVVVVLADTLRADRLGGARHTPSLTPFLDSLAAEGTTFARAYAPSSWTSPSVASLFTSRYPGQHGVTQFGSHLPPEESVLAESLAALGYETATFSAQLLLSPALGLTRGFETVQIVRARADYRRPGTAADVNAAALRWLDGRGEAERARPTFLYLHYMDAHLPYWSPPEFLEPILLRQADPGVARAMAQRAAQRLQDLTSLITPLGIDPAKELLVQRRLADAVSGVTDLYDAQVAYLDAHLRKLFDGLRRRGLLDDCLVVFTADHGHELFEHGQFGHGRTLYEEVVRIPLLLWQGGGPPAVVTTPVSLLDVAPTVLARLGAAVPPAFMGRNLLDGARPSTGVRQWLARLTAPPSPTPAMVFAELYPHQATRHVAGRGDAPQRAVTTVDWKLIAESTGGPERLFHLAVDPGERTPVDDAGVRDALHQALLTFAADTQRAEPAPTPLQLDETTRQRLRDLGYAQ